MTIDSAAGDSERGAEALAGASGGRATRRTVAEPVQKSEATGKTASRPGTCPFTEQVTRPPAEQEEAAEDERVAVDDPLQIALAEVEVGPDRGQRDVHDRRIEDHHELGDADEDEDEPAVGLLASRSAERV